jgi:hypothetical protein
MRHTPNTKREGGAALIVTVMLLVLMGMIGISAMETVTQDRRVAGFQTQSKMALYAAEAGLSDAKERLTTDPNAYDKTAVVPFPNCAASINYGDLAIYGALPYTAQPSYCGDPTIGANPSIQYVGSQPVSINMDQSLPREVYWLYRIRVQGQGSGAHTARLDTVAGAFRLE